MADTTKIEAAVLRKLLDHLAARTDVQNIDLMGHTGFCRNCLSDWYKDAALEEGVTLTKDEARALIYGMPAADFKEKYQTPATDDQLARMDASVAKNKAMRGW